MASHRNIWIRAALGNRSEIIFEHVDVQTVEGLGFDDLPTEFFRAGPAVSAVFIPISRDIYVLTAFAKII